MGSNVAGIETADYEVTEVTHDVESLTELFKGASVVCNTVGPFSRYGPEVVEACLAAGVHYIDTTGEQDWLITCDEQYGADFASAGLLLSPGIAQMYTTGEIAAELRLEKPGLDTLDIAVFWGGSPTIASTQTILFNAALSGAHYLEQNTYVPFDPEAGHYQLAHPRAARARAGAAVGRHLAPGVVQAGPARGQREGAWRGLQPGAHARRTPDRGGRHRGHRRTWATRRSTPPSTRPRPR